MSHQRSHKHCCKLIWRSCSSSSQPCRHPFQWHPPSHSRTWDRPILYCPLFLSPCPCPRPPSPRPTEPLYHRSLQPSMPLACPIGLHRQGQSSQSRRPLLCSLRSGSEPSKYPSTPPPMASSTTTPSCSGPSQIVVHPHPHPHPRPQNQTNRHLASLSCPKVALGVRKPERREIVHTFGWYVLGDVWLHSKSCQSVAATKPHGARQDINVLRGRSFGLDMSSFSFRSTSSNIGTRGMSGHNRSDFSAGIQI